MAGLIYATIPIQTSYNVQLNPRGLGALMLEIVLMLLLVSVASGFSWWVYRDTAHGSIQGGYG